MGRKSKRQIVKEATEFLGIKYRCGNCGKIVTVKVNEYDIHSWASPCDLCGDHGGVDIDVKCPKCDFNIDIDLKSW